MADDKGFELKVGLFVAIGIVLFFMVVFSIEDVNFVKKGYRFYTTFHFSDGVADSAPVRYAGVGVGRVEKISIYFDEAEQMAKVKLAVWVNDENQKIEKNAIATVNTLGLLGEKYVEIFPGSPASGFIVDGDTLPGKDPVMLRSVTDTLTQLATNANDIVVRLKEGKGTIGKLLTEEKIYNDMEAFVADIKAHPWKLLSKPRGE
ncbi:MAG: MlaD family protein [Candidatus Omnitrophica bacterium]|nr:MlaD family protein [Candidatus Omnitrophota bacterium]